MRRIRLSANRIPRPQSSTPQLLEMTSRSVVPASWMAPMSTEGMPQSPNPPTASEAPSPMPSIAAAGEETTLSMASTLSAHRAGWFRSGAEGEAGDVGGDGRGARGGRRWSVEDVDDRPDPANEEVVDEAAVPAHRLGPDARRRGEQVAVLELGQDPADAVTEAVGGDRPDHLLEPGPPVRAGESPEAVVCRDAGQVARVHLAPAVALPGEREDGVGAGMDVAVDAAGEVHAEERERRVRDGIDQSADERGGVGREVVVLTAERDDPHVVDRLRVAERAGQGVCVQPGAVDDEVGRDLAGRRVEQDRGVAGTRPCRVTREDLRSCDEGRARGR